MKPTIVAVSLILSCATAFATPLTAVKTCALEDGTKATLLAKTSPEGSRFFIRMRGKTETAFTDIPDADYVGDIVLAKCIDQVFIFAITYGAPYLKGVVIRRPRHQHGTWRIDFSEKALPERLYLGASEMKLAIPNIGNEVPSKYLIYRFRREQGQDNEPLGSDQLPSEQGLEVKRVR